MYVPPVRRFVRQAAADDIDLIHLTVDGETGHVCADLRAFARRITELMWNVERRGRLAERARAYAISRKWEPSLAPLYAAYRSVRTGIAGRLDARPAAAR